MLTLLNGLRMHIVEASAGSEVSSQTLFTFRQDGPMVSAHYAGGRVLCGYLLAQCTATSLVWRYIQFSNDGTLDAGRATCVIRRSDAGRIQIVESYHWETRDRAGTNVLEEIDSSSMPEEIGQSTDP